MSLTVTPILGAREACSDDRALHAPFSTEPLPPPLRRAALSELLDAKPQVALKLRDREHVKSLCAMARHVVGSKLKEALSGDEVAIPVDVRWERPSYVDPRTGKRRFNKKASARRVVKRAVTLNRDVPVSVRTEDAVYLLDPDRWGYLVEEVDSGAPAPAPKSRNNRRPPKPTDTEG